MPTEVSAVLARNRETKAQADADATIMLASVVVCLLVIILLFADPSFAAAVELTGLY
jgi:hypothetical protein